jgi:hypothetical protein
MSAAGTNGNGANVSEWSGLDTSALDGTGTAQSLTAVSPANSGSVTTANATDVLVAALSMNTYTDAVGAPTGGFTALTSPGAQSAARSAYNIVSTAAAYSTTWSLSPADLYEGVIVAFKQSAPPPTGSAFDNSIVSAGLIYQW